MSAGRAYRACTCYTDDGQTRCGRRDVCTRVIIRSGDGATLQKHWACAQCRERSGLPDYGVVITPAGRRPYRG